MGGNTPEAGPDYNGFMTKSFGRQVTQTYIYFALPILPTLEMGIWTDYLSTTIW